MLAPGRPIGVTGLTSPDAGPGWPAREPVHGVVDSSCGKMGCCKGHAWALTALASTPRCSVRSSVRILAKRGTGRPITFILKAAACRSSPVLLASPSGGQAPDADQAMPLGLRCNPPSSTQPDALRFFKPEDMRANRPAPGALPRGELSGLTLLPPLVRIAGPEKDGVETRGRGNAGPAGLAEAAPVGERGVPGAAGMEVLDVWYPLGVLGLLLVLVGAAAVEDR